MRMRWLDGITDSTDEFEETPGVGNGQGSLGCCSPWGHKELDTTEQLNSSNAASTRPPPQDHFPPRPTLLIQEAEVPPVGLHQCALGLSKAALQKCRLYSKESEGQERRPLCLQELLLLLSCFSRV